LIKQLLILLTNVFHLNYSRNVIDVDWGLVVKLALPGKVTRRAYKVFGIYDRFLTNGSDLEFDNPILKRFHNSFFLLGDSK
jgi:hypothetical protein